MRLLVGVVATLATTAIVGCAASPDTAEPTSSVVTSVSTSTDGETPTGRLFEVDSLGLTFRLPESFASSIDPNYSFFARSRLPPSLFTINGDTPAVIEHQQRPGELLSDFDLGGLAAVEVSDAALEGLPPELRVNELLVANGNQSFSVIMSAPSGELDELWEVFIESVEVD